MTIFSGISPARTSSGRSTRLLETLADDVHGIAAQLQHPQRIGTLFDSIFLAARRRRPRSCWRALDKLPFLIGHFSHRSAPGSTLSQAARVLTPRQIRSSMFRQYFAVAVTHEMNAGDAFDSLTARMVSTAWSWPRPSDRRRRDRCRTDSEWRPACSTMRRSALALLKVARQR
jgi:hypothetical protein